MKRLVLYSFLFLLFFGGSNASLQLAYKPIYVSYSEAKTISYLPAREMKNQGKIYIKDQYIFIGDVGLGVHVIDNSDPTNPQKIGFLQILGNHDISIKGNSLYADNLEDLVTIDISNISNPILTKRIEDVYQTNYSKYPPNVPYGTYFECVDESKGYVAAWEQTEVSDPKCYTTN